MSWLKELGIILVLGCIAVLAAETKNDKEAARVLSEQDVRFFLNPIQIQYTQPTSKPATIVVKPYPAYPDYTDYPPHHHHHHQEQRPRPHRPSNEHHHHHGNSHHHHENSHHHHEYNHEHGPYGYYPLYQSRPSQQSTHQAPILLVYGSENHHHHDNHHHHHNDHGHHHDDHHHHDNWDHDDYDRKYQVKSITENAQTNEEFEDNHDESEDVSNESETDARNANINGIPLINESEEETDSVAIDADNIKLPFGIQLFSQAKPSIGKSNKKFKHQEALIYVKNYKKGRNLEKTD